MAMLQLAGWEVGASHAHDYRHGPLPSPPYLVAARTGILRQKAAAQGEKDMEETTDEDTADAALWIEGHSDGQFNGLYRRDSTRRGLVYKKNKDAYGGEKFCFQCEKPGSNRDDWFLNDKHTPDSDVCYANIRSTGPLPTGDQSWSCYMADGKWETRTLTVTTHVRFHSPWLV